MPAWSVMGAAAILTGCTRLGLSNALIVLESSGAVPLIIPLVLLMVPAKLVADAINEGVYDAQIDALGYLFLPPADTLHSSQRAALQYCKVCCVHFLRQSLYCFWLVSEALFMHRHSCHSGCECVWMFQGFADNSSPSVLHLLNC